ncbi:MAG: signal peptidase I [Bdellovibrio sp.]|nr:signal peptidase I [Bdellovibrio sp.]
MLQNLRYDNIETVGHRLYSYTLSFYILLAELPIYATCPSRIEQVIVNGSSMSPLFVDGQALDLDLNYYSCHEIKRGDIIVFEIPGRKNRIIKKIYAIPSDKFEYKNQRIFINGKTLKNSKNSEYVIDSKMLRLFADSYPTIPKDSYLLLGDSTSGSFDGSKMGFIDRKQVLGKIISSK